LSFCTAFRVSPSFCSKPFSGDFLRVFFAAIWGFLLKDSESDSSQSFFKRLKDLENFISGKQGFLTLFVTLAIFVCQLSMLAEPSGASAQYFKGVSPQLL
jgi:hypothetical protein